MDRYSEITWQVSVFVMGDDQKVDSALEWKAATHAPLVEQWFLVDMAALVARDTSRGRLRGPRCLSGGRWAV